VAVAKLYKSPVKHTFVYIRNHWSEVAMFSTGKILGK